MGERGGEEVESDEECQGERNEEEEEQKTEHHYKSRKSLLNSPTEIELYASSAVKIFVIFLY